MHDFGHAYVDRYAHFFPYDFLEFSRFFWFLEFHSLKTYCYIFDLYLFVLGRDRFFTFVLKEPYYLNFHTNYLIYTSPYFRAFANLGCQ